MCEGSNESDDRSVAQELPAEAESSPASVETRIARAPVGMPTPARYQQADVSGAGDFLSRLSEVAVRLGWGVWMIGAAHGGTRRVLVRNSPFAAGHDPAAYPGCAAISGCCEVGARTLRPGYQNVLMGRASSRAGCNCCRATSRLWRKLAVAPSGPMPGTVTSRRQTS